MLSIAKDADDIGTVPDLDLGIRLTDEVPAKYSYMSIQRSLFDKVKGYLKKLCFHFRKLRSITVP